MNYGKKIVERKIGKQETWKQKKWISQRKSFDHIVLISVVWWYFTLWYFSRLVSNVSFSTHSYRIKIISLNFHWPVHPVFLPWVIQFLFKRTCFYIKWFSYLNNFTSQRISLQLALNNKMNVGWGLVASVASCH